MRRFAIVGHRALSFGKLPLNDLAGAAGRMDVLIRALMASLMTSHGFRRDTEIILHLYGPPGPQRRIKIIGNEVRGIHAEERSVAGQLAKILREPVPAIGHWIERSPGIWDCGGELDDSIKEWHDSTIIALDANAERLWKNDPNVKESVKLKPNNIDISFILSDDKPLQHKFSEKIKMRSLGDLWLQGHMAIGICHFLLDEGFDLNL